jgi:hypothetical protein
MDNQVSNRGAFIQIPAYGPDVRQNLLPQSSSNFQQQQQQQNFEVGVNPKKNWKEYTDPKKWGKRTRNLLIAGGIIMSALALIYLIFAAISYGDAPVDTTTDYKMWDGTAFTAVLEVKSNLPDNAIWAAAYFVSAVGFFLMAGMFDRIWKAIVIYYNPSGLWCFQSAYYGMAAVGVFLLLGAHNMFLLTAVALIAWIIPIMNALGMMLAVKTDVTAPGSSVIVNSGRTMMMFCFIVAGVFFGALAAFAWAYFANLIYGDGADNVATYIYFMICWMIVLCIAHAIVNLRFAWKVQKKKTRETMAGRMVEALFINAIIIIIGAGGFALGNLIGTHV